VERIWLSSSCSTSHHDRYGASTLKFAIVPEHPLDLPPSQIEANRDDWIKEWTDIVVR